MKRYTRTFALVVAKLDMQRVLIIALTDRSILRSILRKYTGVAESQKRAVIQRVDFISRDSVSIPRNPRWIEHRYSNTRVLRKSRC